MASSSSLSFPLQMILRYAPSSSTRLGPGTGYRPLSYSVRLQPMTKGLKSVAAASNQAAAAGQHGDNGIGIPATSLLHLAADEVAPELRIGGALHSPKERPAPPREDSGGKIVHHAAAPTFSKRVRGPTPPPPGLPAEGSGGNGGSKH